ncbi:uncharacterized protein LOC126738599 isoform X2 [Anthonomus grandis grandis]|uniref:uncharacterized protein LOC126738599 isoform X2 n=1 Tax=Anthonomus grandis grandis TaxID=2921223 RepID=UPI002166194E|nr:uncharacterized protein LOC126738599 isoform X2 [Anthonomus grandis grandis]
MRVRAEHWQMLLELCEANPELITNKFNGPDGKTKGHALWQNVAHKLNSLGFGEKTKDEWRRALTDWKCKTKAKAAKIKLEINRTGGGAANYIPLSEIENRLLALMGSKAIEGDVNIVELGFGNETNICGIEADHSLDHPYTKKGKLPLASMNNISTATPKRKITESTAHPVKRIRHVELQRLSKNLLAINEEALKTLQNIDNNMGSIAESLRDIKEILQKK